MSKDRGGEDPYCFRWAAILMLTMVAMLALVGKLVWRVVR